VEIRSHHKAERFIVVGFLLVILAGALLVWLSDHFLYNIPIKPVDALFMATSAVCVTGLASVNVAEQMGPVTQAILLLLIQIGGLGVITALTFLSVVVRRRVGLTDRMFLMSSFGIDSLQGAMHFLRLIIRFTLAVELAGAALLYAGFILQGEPPILSLWHALFHSVSAFCNAGFSTYPDNLSRFYSTFIVPFAVMTLIVAGGVGFPVYLDLREHLCRRTRISHYSKLVFFTTFWLILFGTIFLLISDWTAAFAGEAWHVRLWNALFASVTARTAGFETITMVRFSDFGRAIMVLLMIIGASPASTGGGIKTTTFAILWIAVKSQLRGRAHNVLWHREVAPSVVLRALSLTVLYLSTLFLGAMVLNIIEPMSYGEIFFETASAIGTVGLSVGITPEFSAAGKVILSIIMFWGRVGILTFFASVIRQERGGEVRYAETNIPIG